MKKLLGLLSAFVFAATTSLPVVACSIGNNVDESIDPVLEQQNFNILNDLSDYKDKTIDDYFTAKGIKDEDYFYSKGIDQDNKFIDDRSDSIDGSLGASQWTFIDLLNKKFNLGINKDKTAIKSGVDLGSAKTWGDLENDIDLKIDGTEKLSSLKITGVDGSYQQNGDPAISDNKLTIQAFKDIANIGNEAYWKNGSDPAWKQQLKFIESDKEFYNRTYKKITHVSDGNGNNFDFVQLIMLQNASVIKDQLDESDNKSIISNLESYFKQVTKDDSDTYNALMNQAFSKLNIFTAQKQDYSVSVNLDANYLRDQIKNVLTNKVKFVNDYINANNEKLFGQFFIDNIDTIKSSTVPLAGLADESKYKFNYDAIDSQISDLMDGDFFVNILKPGKVSINSSKDLLAFFNSQNAVANKNDTAVNNSIDRKSASYVKLESSLDANWTSDQKQSAINDMISKAKKTTFTTELNKQAKADHNKEVDFKIFLDKWTGNGDGSLSFNVYNTDFKF